MKLTKNIQEAIDVLKSGGVIVYPTETSYGIGCDATNADAVAKVFAVKHRPEGKGVTLLVASNDPFGESFVTWRPELRVLAEKFWPGALNVVLPVRDDSPIADRCLTDRTVAIRRSSHPAATELVNALGAPLVSTSANISGETELYSAQEIFDRFSRETVQPDLIFDAGEIPKHAPSTLVAWDDARGEAVVLRQGEIVIE